MSKSINKRNIENNIYLIDSPKYVKNDILHLILDIPKFNIRETMISTTVHSLYKDRGKYYRDEYVHRPSSFWGNSIIKKSSFIKSPCNAFSCENPNLMKKVNSMIGTSCKIDDLYSHEGIAYNKHNIVFSNELGPIISRENDNTITELKDRHKIILDYNHHKIHLEQLDFILHTLLLDDTDEYNPDKIQKIKYEISLYDMIGIINLNDLFNDNYINKTYISNRFDIIEYYINLYNNHISEIDINSEKICLKPSETIKSDIESIYKFCVEKIKSIDRLLFENKQIDSDYNKTIIDVTNLIKIILEDDMF